MGDGVVEHPTDSNPIDVSALNAETDEPSSTDIYHHHDAIALQNDRLTSKQIDTPEAVFSMADGCQPGHALSVRVGIIVFCQDVADHIFVQLNSEGMRDLFGNLPATEARIAPLHINNRSNDLP
ncbi:MAG: hypothetical protein ACREVY_16765 [Gammaproteobacteria bacterium]